MNGHHDYHKQFRLYEKGGCYSSTGVNSHQSTADLLDDETMDILAKRKNVLIPRDIPSPPPTPLPPEAALSTQERLRLAKRRRAVQLKRWSQREGTISTSTAPASNQQPPDLIQSHRLPPSSNTSLSTRYISTNNRHISDNNIKSSVIRFSPNIMLLESAARNDIDEVRALLKSGISPDSTNDDGLTALHQCCIDDSESMMALLVDEFSANVNAVDSEKWSPLHAAATCAHLHLVKFLVDRGANLLAVNADGNMPYDLCDDDTTLAYIENEMARRGVTQNLIDTTRDETERKMLSDLQKCVNSGHSEMLDQPLPTISSHPTPLHVASANGYLSVVEFLLDNHVSTEVVDDDGWQPMHAAACWGHLDIVEVLAQNGSNVSAKTTNGETPIDICEDPEIKERLAQLKEQRSRCMLLPPRVRRQRSSTKRTQSIRRTSLREKMNTTRKDVQDEKMMIFNLMQQSGESKNAKNDNYNGVLAHDSPPEQSTHHLGSFDTGSAHNSSLEDKTRSAPASHVQRRQQPILSSKNEVILRPSSNSSNRRIPAHGGSGHVDTDPSVIQLKDIQISIPTSSKKKPREDINRNSLEFSTPTKKLVDDDENDLWSPNAEQNSTNKSNENINIHVSVTIKKQHGSDVDSPQHEDKSHSSLPKTIEQENKKGLALHFVKNLPIDDNNVEQSDFLDENVKPSGSEGSVMLRSIDVKKARSKSRNNNQSYEQQSKLTTKTRTGGKIEDKFHCISQCNRAEVSSKITSKNDKDSRTTKVHADHNRNHENIGRDRSKCCTIT